MTARNILIALSLVLLMGMNPLPKLVGIEFGQELDVFDEEVRKSYGLSAPATVNLVQENVTYYQCDSVAPKDGFDSFSVDVTLDKKVFGISADVKCKDKEEVKRKVKEISDDLKKRFADRVNEGGHILLTVSSGDDFVEVDMKENKAEKNTEETK